MQNEDSSDKISAKTVLRRLKKWFRDAECTLDYRDEFELLIATILSAQCTDVRVNRVTPILFSRLATPDDFAQAPLAVIENLIASCGFYHTKAKNIQNLSRILVERYEGRVPATLEALVALPGVGRKTAHVVLGNGFGIVSGVVVDTHVGRISRRLGLTTATDPVKVERDLALMFPKKEWVGLSHRMIQLGRTYCTARSPKCAACPMFDLCPNARVDLLNY